MKKIGLPIILALLALSVTTIAQDPSPSKAAQSSQNRTSQGKKPDPLVGTSRDGNQGAPLQAPGIEDHNQNIYTNETKPDWWARIIELVAAAATIALAIIGYLGVRAAQRTLNEIKEQTGIAKASSDAAKDAAGAALLNAQAVINSERPFIEGELVRDEETKKISVVRYVLKIRNYGKTPAYLLNYEVKRQISNPTGSDGTRTVTLNRYLGSDATDFFDQFNMKDIFGDDCESGTLCLTIRYTDMLGEREGRERHETSLLYCYNPLTEKLDRVNASGNYT